MASYEVTDFEQRVQKRVSQLEVDREARKRIRLADAGDWESPEELTEESIRLEMMWPDRIKGLLRAEGVALLVAQRKTGKTTLISNVVKSLCDGVPLFERYETSAEVGKVGLFDLEMPQGLLGQWLLRMNIQNLDKLAIYATRGKVSSSFSILRDNPERFGQFLKEQGITTLIIDPIAPLLAVIEVDENDNAGVRRFLTSLRDVATEAGVKEIFITHHTGWGENNRSRGASSFEDTADVIWRLQREGKARLFSAFGRTQEIDPCPLTLREDGQLYLSPNEITFGDF